jgi:uncharacterized RDD family membrane protein YckC
MADLFTESETSPNLASKSRRMIAIIIDYFIYFLISYYLLGLVGERYETEDGTVGFRAEGFPALLSTIPWFVVMPLLEGMTGQTIGKMILKIKVVRADGTNISIGPSIARHLFDIVDYLPFFGIVGLIVASNNELNQRVGDLVAKTIVIEI